MAKNRIPRKPGPQSDWKPGLVSTEYRVGYDQIDWNPPQLSKWCEPCALCGADLVWNEVVLHWTCPNPECFNYEPTEEEDDELG